MTSPPHDLNGEEPARNDYRGGRAERHRTIRGCAARGGFGASSIRQPRGALNSIIGAPPQLRPAQASSAPIRHTGDHVKWRMPGATTAFGGVSKTGQDSSRVISLGWNNADQIAF